MKTVGEKLINLYFIQIWIYKTYTNYPLINKYIVDVFNITFVFKGKNKMLKLRNPFYNHQIEICDEKNYSLRMKKQLEESKEHINNYWIKNDNRTTI